MWVLLAPGVLFGLPLLGALIVYACALRGIKTRRDVEYNRLDGRGWIPDHIYEHYGHWLPKLLGVSAISIGRHQWYRDHPPPRKDLPPVALRPTIQLFEAAHEYGHSLGWLLASDVAEALHHLLGFVAHLAAKYKRPEEIFAYENQRAIAQNRHPQCRFPGDSLRKAFTDNYNDPDDPSTWRSPYQAPPWWGHWRTA